MVFGWQNMEINLGIPDDWCQGDAAILEPLDPEEYEFPAEDRKVPKLKSVKVTRAKKRN